MAWCREHEVLLVSDIAYSELGFDPDSQPPSVFQVEGAREVAVEFQSLSKSHNLAGWRVGFAVGGAEVIGNLGRVKSNVDFSLFGGHPDGRRRGPDRQPAGLRRQPGPLPAPRAN